MRTDKKTVRAFSSPQTIYPASIGSSEVVSSVSLYKAPYSNFRSEIYSPAYEVGYYDVIALSREFSPDPDFILDYANINANYLFSVTNLSLASTQKAEADSRLAGEGASPNTVKIDKRELNLSFNIPIKVDSWGFVDYTFAALFDFYSEGFKGSPTSYIGRFTSDNSAVIGIGTTILYVDSIAELKSFTLPFTAKIKSDTSTLVETVTVSGIDKSTRKVTLSSGLAATCSRSTGYLYAYPSNTEREPSFSLFSLQQGLLTGCLVDSISFTINPAQELSASVNMKVLSNDRKYQIDVRNNLPTILANYSKRKPSQVLYGNAVRVGRSIPEYGSFGLGSASDSSFFRGFQQSLLNNVYINEITLEFGNNLQPIYTLNSRSSNYIVNQNKNLLPFGYYSDGRIIKGSITYSGPVEPWLFAEFLSGPASINNGGITFDMGTFKIELPEIVFAPESLSYSVDSNIQKKINFSVVVQNYSYIPILKSTGNL